ncbi:MAG: nucleotidyltransferase [Gemmataceae bacterium]|nr:nucleotidyltransferase [Gemmataceae bacterium]
MTQGYTFRRRRSKVFGLAQRKTMSLRRRHRFAPGSTRREEERSRKFSAIVRPMSSNPALQRLPAAIQAICRAHPVVLAYLFGSHARGTADSESDVDIAVLADESLTPLARSELRFRLMRTLAENLALPLEQIDLILLQDVPSLLQRNVIRGGSVLFARDTRARREFELFVDRRYEDESPDLEREATITVERILSHAV